MVSASCPQKISKRRSNSPGLVIPTRRVADDHFCACRRALVLASCEQTGADLSHPWLRPTEKVLTPARGLETNSNPVRAVSMEPVVGPSDRGVTDLSIPRDLITAARFAFLSLDVQGLSPGVENGTSPVLHNGHSDGQPGVASGEHGSSHRLRPDTSRVLYTQVKPSGSTPSPPAQPSKPTGAVRTTWTRS